MSILDAIILGIVQGFTEFIPISSSGHLVLAEKFLGLPNNFTFSILLNVGTLLALLIFFRARIINIFQETFRNKNYRYAAVLVTAVIPAAVIGFLLGGWLDDIAGTGWITVIALAAVAIPMILFGREKATVRVMNDNQATFKDALFIGLAQVLALVPGVSRSGSTILAGINRGFSARAAADFSFLIGAPTVLGAIVYSFVKDDGLAFIKDNTAIFIAGNLASFLCGILAVKLLINFLGKHGLKVFGWYRLGLAVFLAVLLLTKTIE